MAAIEGLDDVISRIGEFSFAHFTEVRELRFWQAQQGEHTVPTLHLTLASRDRFPGICLRLELSGVHDLSISGFGEVAQIAGLAVDGISTKQWDRIAWELLDFENDVIHCYAKDAAVTLLSPEVQDGET